MAKATEPKTQTTIEGAADKVTRRVRESARLYAKTLFQRQKLQEDEAVLKPALDEKMLEDGVEKLEVVFMHEDKSIRYEVKRSKVDATSKITCKKLGDDAE